MEEDNTLLVNQIFAQIKSTEMWKENTLTNSPNKGGKEKGENGRKEKQEAFYEGTLR